MSHQVSIGSSVPRTVSRAIFSEYWLWCAGLHCLIASSCLVRVGLSCLGVCWIELSYRLILSWRVGLSWLVLACWLVLSRLSVSCYFVLACWLVFEVEAWDAAVRRSDVHKCTACLSHWEAPPCFRFLSLLHAPSSQVVPPLSTSREPLPGPRSDATAWDWLNSKVHSPVSHIIETRQDKTRQDKTRQDKTRQDKTRQDKTRQDKTTTPLTLHILVTMSAPFLFVL